MALLNYTTKIEADKTAGEIAELLRRSGAKAILTEYDEKSEYVKSLAFKMNVGEKEMHFKLPCDWKPVQEVLKIQKERNSRIDTSQGQAVRTSWRIVYVWVKAQLAIIETKMVKTEEIFLPYLIMKDGRTLSENVQTDPRFLLG